jgi:hypothetical protein
MLAMILPATMAFSAGAKKKRTFQSKSDRTRGKAGEVPPWIEALLADISNPSDLRLNLACDEFHPTKGYLNSYLLWSNDRTFTSTKERRCEVSDNRILVDMYPEKGGEISHTYLKKVYCFEQGRLCEFASSSPQPAKTPPVQRICFGQRSRS